MHRCWAGTFCLPPTHCNLRATPRWSVWPWRSHQQGCSSGKILRSSQACHGRPLQQRVSIRLRDCSPIEGARRPPCLLVASDRCMGSQCCSAWVCSPHSITGPCTAPSALPQSGALHQALASYVQNRRPIGCHQFSTSASKMLPASLVADAMTRLSQQLPNVARILLQSHPAWHHRTMSQRHFDSLDCAAQKPKLVEMPTSAINCLCPS